MKKLSPRRRTYRNSEAYVLYLTALGKEATDWRRPSSFTCRPQRFDPKFALAYAHSPHTEQLVFPSGERESARSGGRGTCDCHQS
jgi:hypothetical protein